MKLILIVVLQVHFLKIFAEKYNIHMLYLENCLSKTLQRHIEKTSIRDVLAILHKKSFSLENLMKENFIRYYFVKSIIGTIQCCIPFGSHDPVKKEQKLKSSSPSPYANDCSPFNCKFQLWIFNANSKFKINITFLEVNMMHEFKGDCILAWLRYSKKYHIRSQEILFIDKEKPKRYRGEYMDGLCFTGKRNTFNFISHKGKLLIGVVIVPTDDIKLKALFTVLDSRLVRSFGIEYGYRNVYPTILLVNTVNLTNSIGSKMSYLVLKGKFQRVVLRLWHNNASRIELFDGPDDKSLSVKSAEGYTLFSTFQCFVKIYAATSVEFASVIRISGIAQDVFQHVTVHNANLPLQDICIMKIVHHCIINVTGTNNVYLNVSIIDMKYSGPNIRNCQFGGVSYYEKIYNRSDPEERKSFCGRYTRNPQNNSFDIVPMSYVTEGHSLLIVFYGYYPHNQGMEINMEITITPCKGLYFCNKGEYVSFRNKTFHLLFYNISFVLRVYC